MVKNPLKVGIKGFLGYKHIKHTEVLDKTSFPICKVKEKEIGFSRKRIWYVHRLKNGWDIIQIHPKYIHKVYKTKNDK